jgi:hypothetical protein
MSLTSQIAKFLVCLCSLFLAGHTSAVEILSKSDAKQTFESNYEQWETNLRNIQLLGLGKVERAGRYELTLIVQASTGLLKVTPSFLPNQLHRPHRISVSVEQTEVFSRLTTNLSDEVIRKMIAEWQHEMLPEFTVMTNVDLVGGVAQFDFTIFEVGVYPLMDQLAKQTRGCWQQCVMR